MKQQARVLLNTFWQLDRHRFWAPFLNRLVLLTFVYTFSLGSLLDFRTAKYLRHLVIFL